VRSVRAPQRERPDSADDTTLTEDNAAVSLPFLADISRQPAFRAVSGYLGLTVPPVAALFGSASFTDSMINTTILYSVLTHEVSAGDSQELYKPGAPGHGGAASVLGLETLVDSNDGHAEVDRTC
jgi:hypothetical protein